MGKINIKDPQYMVLTSSTIRGIINTLNERNIKRENIITLIKENEQFVLIYCK